MGKDEIVDIIVAVLVLFVVIGIKWVLEGNIEFTVKAFVYAFVVIFVYIGSKKVVAHMLDADVEHGIWKMGRYGWKPGQIFRKEKSMGVILPLVVAFIGALLAWKFGFVIYFMGILTYEARALKRRAARRHGFYSFSEMTDFHNALIGAAGIVSLLILSVVTYYFGLEFFTKILVYYAFWNILPISNLDGTQIFFGSRVLYGVLFVTTLTFSVFALII
jgi:hypothetical protein